MWGKDPGGERQPSGDAAEQLEARPAGDPGGCFLPNFCRLPAALAVIVTAELFAMVLSLASAAGIADLWDALSRRSLFVQWVAITTAALLCALRPWLARAGTVSAGLLAWGLLMLVALGVTEVAVWGWSGTLRGAGAPAPAHRDLLAQALGISAIAGALLLRYLYVQHQWRRHVEAESQARFDALQSRIRPHFLFNSMNTIASLTRTDPALAEEVVSDLADLFRATLGEPGRLVALDDELELARGYLRIEQQRLGPRLQASWDLEGLPRQALVPPLVLQPLLENAVFHGIERLPGPGTIRIVGRHRRGLINLSVRNSLPPPSTRARHGGHRLALENIRARLAGCFGDAATLTAGEVEGEYQVRMAFPHPWKPQ